MTLTIEKRITEEVDIDLTKPIYRWNGASMYFKFEMINGEVKTTAFDSVVGFDLSIRPYMRQEAVLSDSSEFKEITEEEFYSALRNKLIENNLI